MSLSSAIIKNVLQGMPAQRRRSAAQAFVRIALNEYWQRLPGAINIGPFSYSENAPTGRATMAVTDIALKVGEKAAKLSPMEAGHLIGSFYTSALPHELRGQLGAYYTPPPLVERLISLSELQGIRWSKARILDPACGGGAFLAPIAERIRNEIANSPADVILATIESQLEGWEIDPMAASIAQVTVEAACLDLMEQTGRRLSWLVKTRDSLFPAPHKEEPGTFDLVIGNPPYGRIGLHADARKEYSRSLYGHANLYGLFTDLAIRLVKPHGVIAYVTPTSFLGGKYFKNLRALLADQAPPARFEFVQDRKHVFADVLQETLLTVYSRSSRPSHAQVAILDVNENTVSAQIAGTFDVIRSDGEPWSIPRDMALAKIVRALSSLPWRLKDYGYKVSTGPLVWNRVKSQLKEKHARDRIPVLWAECIALDGNFTFNLKKRAHGRWFEPGPGDNALIIKYPCVLVQRTTAKEQKRRLIAADMPMTFLEKYGAVTIENHVNMVRPLNGCPAVPTFVIAALLNSQTADQVFRCFSGSVAVSASEIEAMPLPSPNVLNEVRILLERGAAPSVIEATIAAGYEAN